MSGDPSKFARFVTSMVFQLLDIPLKSEKDFNGVPPSPPLHDQFDTDLVYLSLDIVDHAPQILYCVHHILHCTAQSISLSIVVLALKYINRIISYQVKTPKAGSEAHLFCVCLILAQKQLDDHAFKNKTWSKITLIPVNVITQMERECLSCLKFDLYVGHKEFSVWHSTIQRLALGWNQGYVRASRSHSMPYYFRKTIERTDHSRRHPNPIVLSKKRQRSYTKASILVPSSTIL